ncbi:periphilin-1-like [Myxocyprinus asiaticus]|uniref:periphilin-1-like n=1 Tax=Myxocyprinus asiaticus TaxID=70543 RepID=UPI0022230093|nr:periphilin-1-like [Myxocyprinus asiaticus]
MSFRIRRLYERCFTTTPVSNQRVRLVSRRPDDYEYTNVCTDSQYYESDGDGHRDRRDEVMNGRTEARYVNIRTKEDSPSGLQQADYRCSSRVIPQPGVRGQRSSAPQTVHSAGEDAVLQAIKNLHKHVDCESVKHRNLKPSVRRRPTESRCELSRTSHQNPSRSASVQKPKQMQERKRKFSSENSSSSFFFSAQTNISTERPGHTSSFGPPYVCVPLKKQCHTHSEQHEEEDRPHVDLAGGSKNVPPHRSPSASKIFFSDLDEIPGLGGELKEHVETSEESRAQTITTKAVEIEKLYKQDCETLGTVVKMLIAKGPTLEQQLLSALKKNLVDIRERSLENFRQFISEVNEPVGQT